MATKITLTAIGIWLTVAGAGGCVTHSSGLDTLKAQQRHELYKRCVDTQTKRASFGSGMAVHQACLERARRRIR
jgi:hypothetical protein